MPAYTIKRPMLAPNQSIVEADMPRLSYPLIASPKLDGIRCIIIDGQALSRSFKPIKNAYIRHKLRNLPTGLDGELMQGTTFQACTSAVMSEDGEPDFRYHVFDFVSAGLNEPYESRLKVLADWYAHSCKLRKTIKVVPTTYIRNKDDLIKYEEWALEQGFEGLIVRSPTGPYKCGRATWKQGWMLKLKRFVDGEAEVIGMVEQMHNANEQTTNELGLSKRSHAKSGMVPAGTLGTLQVRDLKTGVEFEIGTFRGWDAKFRKDVWLNRHRLMGGIVKYKSQPHGVKDKPRIPVGLGWRDPEDM